MSIINQTLRDLDARKADPESPRASVNPVSVPPPRRRGIWIAGLALLPLAGFALWFGLRPAELASQSQAAGVPVAVAPLPADTVLDTASDVRTVAPPVQTPINIQLEPAVTASPVKPFTPGLPVLPSPESGAEVRPEPALAPPPASINVQPSSVVTATRAQDVKREVPALQSQEPVPVAAQPERSASSPQPAAAIKPTISKAVFKLSAEEEAEERYRKAVTLVQKGRENQARPLLEEAIKLSPTHVAARQALVTLLSEADLNREAEAILREGRVATPGNAWFALNLARMEVARGDVEGAARTLQSGVEGGAASGEYRATLAALLLRLKRHPEAAQQYEQALKLQPNQGPWWMGLGLALAAQGKTEEARSAYNRALGAGNLPEKLAEFVRLKLVE